MSTMQTWRLRSERCLARRRVQVPLRTSAATIWVVVIFKTVAIFLLAVLGELAGTYAIWRWRRLAGPAWLIGAGIGALFLYALVQTYQPETSFGRLYAAYAGVFLVGAMTWGWLVDGVTPDMWDLLGACIVIVGVVVVLFGRNLAG